ncbi:MAG: hypothetical protein AB2L09_08200 [Coriobacteriia bacterium]
MSSHILGEVAHLADRIGIVHRGRLLQELAYDELLANSRRCLEVVVNDPDRAAELLAERLGATPPERGEDGALRLYDGAERAPDVARWLVEAGFELRRLAESQEDLESYFMRLTGEDS